VAELALDQRQRDTLVKQLDSVRVAELMGREAPECDLVQLEAGGAG